MLVLERADSVFVNRGTAHLHMGRRAKPVQNDRVLPPAPAGGVHEERALVAATIPGEFQMWHFVASSAALSCRTLAGRRLPRRSGLGALRRSFWCRTSRRGTPRSAAALAGFLTAGAGAFAVAAGDAARGGAGALAAAG